MSFEELQQIVSICLDEIVALKEENATLKKELKNVALAVKELLDNQKDMMQEIHLINDNTNITYDAMVRFVDNVKYELNDPDRDMSLYYYPKFYSVDETIRDIVENKRSMARFGDGEFAIMSNVVRQKFQRLDEHLATRLKEIICKEEEGFLVGIADNYGSLEEYNESGKSGIRCYMTNEVRKEHAKYIDLGRVYHNAYISRPYVLWADNMSDAPLKRFNNLKKIWDKRNIIFVEGSLTRLGVGNDLFDNATQIRRIEAPAENSYDKYYEILESALHYAENDTLFLIALGPTAGVLAYDLYKAGYQAIDIGHVDLEYEWYLGGKGARCKVENKYNNEFPGGNIVEEIQDEEYYKQIICCIQ